MTDAPHAATAPVADLVGFTPGPWHRNIKPATRYPTVWSGRNTHVAYVVRERLPVDQIEANLDLIVLAPTLYANDKLLREINAELVAALQVLLASASYSTDAMDDAEDQARAVLAKAASFTAGKSEGAT